MKSVLRYLLPRHLSARILLGFAVLTITFGAIAATLVWYSSQVENQLFLIRNGYVPLSLKSKELTNRQDDLRNYLEKQLVEESNSSLAKQNIHRYRGARDRFLEENRKVLFSLEQLVEVDAKEFGKARPWLDSLETGVAALAPLYDQLLASPPLDVQAHLHPTAIVQAVLEAFLLPVPPADPKHDAAVAALDRLRTEERRLFQQTGQLASLQEQYVVNKSTRLLEAQQIVRVRTIYLGAAAVALGLLITLWVVITLRPLRKLRDGARRIAAGDYASRIAEGGPTEVAELAREFNAMGRAVEEREREKVRSERLAAVGQMAALMTHEVRNPLSAIGLNTELLEDELGDAASSEARELCRSIHREVDRLTAITEEYLASSRLPKPKLAAEPVNPLVSSLATFVREELAAKQVQLELDLAPNDPMALIDSGQIRQCLINLIRNAADALVNKVGGTVKLRTRSLGRKLEITVEDNGVGIAPELHARLFDPLFSTKEGGNGLGLALTQQIVHEHGGLIRVDSEVGVGTTFTVVVPAAL